MITKQHITSKFWKRRGECSYGDQCAFLHPEDERGVQIRRTGPSPTRWVPSNLTGVCINFLKGDCRRGKDRTLSHPTPGSRPKEVCRMFARGMCRFGGNCEYLHTGEVEKLKQPNQPSAVPTIHICKVKKPSLFVIKQSSNMKNTNNMIDVSHSTCSLT